MAAAAPVPVPVPSKPASSSEANRMVAIVTPEIGLLEEKKALEMLFLDYGGGLK